MRGSRDDERVEEAGEDEEQAEESGSSSRGEKLRRIANIAPELRNAADELTREAEDLGMYCTEPVVTNEHTEAIMAAYVRHIAPWCPTGECVTKPQASGFCASCQEKIEELKERVWKSYEENACEEKIELLKSKVREALNDD